jgi:hypothetical protein
MALTVEKLIEESRSERLQRLPQYAQELIHDLAHRLDAEHRYAQSIRERAEKEVDEVRKLAAEGPEDSDTFVSLPHSVLDSGDFEERPLGQGVTVEFRAPGLEPGEGFDVKMTDGHLVVSGVNRLGIVPVHASQVEIRAV